MSTLTEAAPAAIAQPEASELTYREAVNAALEDAMAEDPTVVLMGEDVNADGGVFKTNIGLPDKFPGRVLATPICENGFMGVALGMSITGMRPVVEIMFADFLPTAGDAIVNQLPKYRYMSGGQFTVPVTVRIMCGGGGRFGTQHSATAESWYMAQPGMRIAAASSPQAAYELLRASIRNNDPTLFYEHKALYPRKGMVRRGVVAEIGTAQIVREGNDVTIVGTLLMVERALQAAETLASEGISAEVIDLRWIRPIDLPTIEASVRRTGRLVIAEEQWHEGGWGATVISELAQRGVTFRTPPVTASLPHDLLIPYSPTLEDEMLPSAERIAATVRTAIGR
jgi:acetoin:2,6-dichlorophenolindophenol oxidoreductase subunit beta